jgi:hypothetical protein
MDRRQFLGSLAHATAFGVVAGCVSVAVDESDVLGVDPRDEALQQANQLLRDVMVLIEERDVLIRKSSETLEMAIILLQEKQS